MISNGNGIHAELLHTVEQGVNFARSVEKREVRVDVQVGEIHPLSYLIIMIIAVQSGRIPQLTGHETKSVIARDVAPHLAISIVQAKLLQLHTDDGEFAWGQLPRESAATTLAKLMSNWISRLGGVRRLMVIAKEGLAEQGLLSAMLEHLPIKAAAEADERLVIGISADNLALSARRLKRLGYDLKEQLSKKQVRARIVFASEGSELSAAAIKHNHLTTKGIEWVIGRGGKGYWLAKTIAAYDPDRDAWLDRGIPKSDAKSGMLPPKIARMMVNIAAGPLQNPLVVDPFCGNGRVLLEGLLLRYEVRGSDMEPNKVEATQQNIDWLRTRRDMGELPTSTVKVADARLAADNPGREWVLVTEPWLGPPLRRHPSMSQALTLQKDVAATLYPALQQQLAKRPKRAVIIAPSWQVGGTTITTQNTVLDAAAANGYRTECIASVARDDSFVTRDVILITKHGA